MLRLAKTLILFAAVACLVAGTMPALATGWDLYADWSTATASGNHDWSYGYTYSSSYSFTQFEVNTVLHPEWGNTGNTWTATVPLSVWNEYGAPNLAKNPGGGNYGGSQWLGTAIINAFPSGSPSTVVIARWTAAVGGTYAVTASAVDTSPDMGVMIPAKFSIVAGGTTILNPTLTNRSLVPVSYSGNVTLTQGQVVDFIVADGDQGRNDYRNIGLTAHVEDASVTASVTGWVTSSVVPHPGVDGVTVSGGGATVTSDSAGYYTLTVVKGSYDITYSKTNWVTQTIPVSANSNVTQNVQLVPFGTVSGVVSDTTGPIAGATVSAGAVTATTNSSGSYSLILSEGPHTVDVSAPLHTAQSIPSIAVSNATNTPLNITLVKWGTISGTVSDSTGPIWGATVSAAGGATTTTASNGTYSLTLAEGTYTVDASALAHTSQSIPSVSVTDATNTPLNVTLVGTIIKGRVTSDLPGNPPVSGATVSAKQGLSTIATVTTDVNGNYAMTVAAGTYTLKAEKTGYDPFSVPGVSVATDQIVVVNIPALHHLGTWDLAGDFDTGTNPNGQWSYGHAGFQNGTTLTAPFTLYTAAQTFLSSNPATGWGAGIGTNTDKRDDPGHGWVWKNMTGAAVVSNWWYGSTSLPTWQIEPGAVSISGGDTWGGYAGTIRWTSPDKRIIDLNLTLKGQNMQGGGLPIVILKNGTVLATKTVDGFYGTPPDYTDRSGTSPISTFASTLVVNTNDTLDFLASTGYPWPSADISIIISRNTSIAQCASINDLKAQPLGAQVMLTTPMAVTAGVNRYNTSYAFYIESDDRSQAAKLIGDADTTVVAEGTKITFSGKVIADPDDPSRNVIQVASVNDQVPGAAIKPLGASGKALGANPTLRDKLIRVWGKVTSVVPNTNMDPSEFFYDDVIDPGHTNPLRKWPYEYYVINDGSGDIKIKMRGQSTWMSDPTPVGAGTLGHYIAVVGIGRKEGTDNVVFPRGYGSGLSDIDDYWSNQNPQ